jgi:hypothetical protein
MPRCAKSSASESRQRLCVRSPRCARGSASESRQRLCVRSPRCARGSASKSFQRLCLQTQMQKINVFSKTSIYRSPLFFPHFFLFQRFFKHPKTRHHSVLKFNDGNRTNEERGPLQVCIPWISLDTCNCVLPWGRMDFLKTPNALISTFFFTSQLVIPLVKGSIKILRILQIKLQFSLSMFKIRAGSRTTVT